MFSPTLGRWTQNDPIEYDPGDPNLYQFVGNSPQVGLDPTGLADIKDAEAFKAILKEIGAGTDTGKAFEVITRLSLATQGGLKANTGLGANEAYVASTANPALVIPASLAGKRDAILRGASGNATPDLVGDFTLGKVGAAKMVLVDAKALDKNITLAGNTRSPYQSVKYIANLVQNATLFGTQGGAAAELGQNDRVAGILLYVTYTDTKVSPEIVALGATNGVVLHQAFVDWDKAKCEFYVTKSNVLAPNKGENFRAKTLIAIPNYAPFQKGGVVVTKEALLKALK